MKYVLFWAALFLFSCIKSHEKTEAPQITEALEQPVETNTRFPYTEKDVQQFYSYNSAEGVYEMSVPDSKWTTFELNGVNLPIKENDFALQPTVNTKYTVLETLEFPSLLSCKILLYKTLGDNDISILNVQLNSYIDGNLKDQILLDSRFTFETEYYRTFEIHKDQKINIQKFSVNHLEFNEAGDIVGDKKVPDTLKVTVNYQLMADGIFKKL